MDNAIGIVTTVLGMIETFLPMLATATAGIPVAGPIIATLTVMMPMIEQVVKVAPQVYTSIKGIVTALKSDPNTTKEQLAALKEFDAKIDLAFEAAAADVDPDAPGAAGA